MTDVFLVFWLDEQRYGIPLPVVDRVVHRVEINALGEVPSVIAGRVNVQGRDIPVFDLRMRFGLPERNRNLNDRLIIARTRQRLVALVVDDIVGLVECGPQDLIAATQILPHIDYVEAVVKQKDGLILIHSLDTFLSSEEASVMQAALEGG